MSTRTLWKDGDRVREVEITATPEGRYLVRVDQAEFALEVTRLANGVLQLSGEHGVTRVEATAAGERRFVNVSGMDFVFERETQGRKRAAASAGSLEAPMPGVVTRVLVAIGDAVTQGQPLVALEAMKMEHMIRAPRDGKVRSVGARTGEMVAGGARLVELEDA